MMDDVDANCIGGKECEKYTMRLETDQQPIAINPYIFGVTFIFSQFSVSLTLAMA